MTLAEPISQSQGLWPQRQRIDQLDVARLGTGRWILPPDRNSERTTLVLLFAARGVTSIAQADWQTLLNESELVITPTTVPTALVVAEPGELIVVRIPENIIGPHVSTVHSVVRRVISAQNGTASLVAHVLSALSRQTEYEPRSPGRLAQHIVGLFNLMCLDGASALGTGHWQLLQQAKERVESSLSDVELSPDRLAASMNLSARTLHRLFEGQGVTIGAWIRLRRLEHARAELSDHAFDHLSVSGIGARWGLPDAAHFSRLFKAQYGVSPRAYRMTATEASFADSPVAYLTPRSL